MTQRDMPRLRDISVRKTSPSPAEPAPSSAETSRSTPGMVTVMGFDRNEVLLRSDKVNVIQVRGPSGEITAMLIRLKPNIWGFSKSGDEDWSQVLALYGNEDAK